MTAQTTTTKQTAHENFKRLARFIRQATTFRRAPLAPPPDYALLAGEGLPGSERYTLSSFEGRMVIIASLPRRRGDTRPDHLMLVPELAAVIQTLCTFSGNLLACASSGTAETYRLFGGPRRVSLARLMVDARRGDIVRCDRELRCFVQPERFTKASTEELRDEGFILRMSSRGREQARQVAMWNYRRLHRRYGIPISATGYTRLIAAAFKLLDQFREEREAHLRSWRNATFIAPEARL